MNRNSIVRGAIATAIASDEVVRLQCATSLEGLKFSKPPDKKSKDKQVVNSKEPQEPKITKLENPKILTVTGWEKWYRDQGLKIEIAQDPTYEHPHPNLKGIRAYIEKMIFHYVDDLEYLYEIGASLRTIKMNYRLCWLNRTILEPFPADKEKLKLLKSLKERNFNEISIVDSTNLGACDCVCFEGEGDTLPCRHYLLPTKDNKHKSPTIISVDVIYYLWYQLVRKFLSDRVRQLHVFHMPKKYGVGRLFNYNNQAEAEYNFHEDGEFLMDTRGNTHTYKHRMVVTAQRPYIDITELDYTIGSTVYKYVVFLPLHIVDTGDTIYGLFEMALSTEIPDPIGLRLINGTFVATNTKKENVSTIVKEMETQCEQPINVIEVVSQLSIEPIIVLPEVPILVEPLEPIVPEIPIVIPPVVIIEEPRSFLTTFTDSIKERANYYYTNFTQLSLTEIVRCKNEMMDSALTASLLAKDTIKGVGSVALTTYSSMKELLTKKNQPLVPNDMVETVESEIFKANRYSSIVNIDHTACLDFQFLDGLEGDNAKLYKVCVDEKNKIFTYVKKLSTLDTKIYSPYLGWINLPVNEMNQAIRVIVQAASNPDFTDEIVAAKTKATIANLMTRSTYNTDSSGYVVTAIMESSRRLLTDLKHIVSTENVQIMRSNNKEDYSYLFVIPLLLILIQLMFTFVTDQIAPQYSYNIFRGLFVSWVIWVENATILAHILAVVLIAVLTRLFISSTSKSRNFANDMYTYNQKLKTMYTVTMFILAFLLFLNIVLADNPYYKPKRDLQFYNKVCTKRNIINPNDPIWPPTYGNLREPNFLDVNFVPYYTGLYLDVERPLWTYSHNELKTMIRNRLSTLRTKDLHGNYSEKTPLVNDEQYNNILNCGSIIMNQLRTRDGYNSVLYHAIKFEKYYSRVKPDAPFYYEGEATINADRRWSEDYNREHEATVLEYMNSICILIAYICLILLLNAVEIFIAVVYFILYWRFVRFIFRKLKIILSFIPNLLYIIITQIYKMFSRIFLNKYFVLAMIGIGLYYNNKSILNHKTTTIKNTEYTMESVTPECVGLINEVVSLGRGVTYKVKGPNNQLVDFGANIACNCNTTPIGSKTCYKIADVGYDNEMTYYKTCWCNNISALNRLCWQAPRNDPAILNEFSRWFDVLFMDEIIPILEDLEVCDKAWFNHLNTTKQTEVKDYFLKNTKTGDEMKEIKLEDVKDYNTYTNFVKAEKQPSLVKTRAKKEKTRCICSPGAAYKKIMGPVTYPLELLFKKAFKGYNVPATWGEQETMLDRYEADGFTETIQADGKGFDICQNLELKRIVDHRIYKWIVQNKNLHIDPKIFELVSCAETRKIVPQTMEKGTIKRYGYIEVIGRVLSGSCDTTLMNTIRMSCYMRFICERAKIDYRLWVKGDDVVIFCSYADRHKILKSLYEIFTTEEAWNANNGITHGLGQIAKFVKIGGIVDFDFCSTMVIRTNSGFKICRKLENIYLKEHYSTKIKPGQEEMYHNELRVSADAWLGKETNILTRYYDILHPRSDKKFRQVSRVDKSITLPTNITYNKNLVDYETEMLKERSSDRSFTDDELFSSLSEMIDGTQMEFYTRILERVNLLEAN